MSLNEALNRANKAEYTSEFSDIETGAKNIKRKRKTECLNNDQVQSSNFKSLTITHIITYIIVKGYNFVVKYIII